MGLEFRSRLLKDLLQSSSGGLQAGFVQSGSDAIFSRRYVFRATMIVVGLLLLVLICIARWDSILECVLCRRVFPSRRRRSTSQQQQQQQQVSSREIMQKVWCKQVMVDAVRYSAKAAADHAQGSVAASSTECMICLNEFSESEMVRILPTCSHCFHVHCIDLWLLCHLSCPICRNAITHTLPFSSVSILPQSTQP